MKRSEDTYKYSKNEIRIFKITSRYPSDQCGSSGCDLKNVIILDITLHCQKPNLETLKDAAILLLLAKYNVSDGTSCK